METIQILKNIVQEYPNFHFPPVTQSRGVLNTYDNFNNNIYQLVQGNFFDTCAFLNNRT